LGTSQKRPRAADKSPNINQPLDLLKKLLAIEEKRLETAVRIEEERKIVFPETSVIIHDIMKIHDAIGRKVNGVCGAEDILNDI
jgi:hypothetical protein